MTIPLSFLDLAPVSAGQTRKQALDESLRLVQHLEQLGFKRYWMAEHHGSATFMSSATSLLLGRAGEHTSTIRLGSGGVMLPNHTPLMVAEYYGTLATLYPDRIDLGLGRAPGTDPVTAAELRRGESHLNSFANDVVKLKTFLAPTRVEANPSPSGAEASILGISPTASRATVRAIPGEGTEVPLWMLGSSQGGAAVAAELGLPFSFASHFAPQALVEALHTYRGNFKADAPTADIVKPVVMAGVNVVVADTDEDARFLATTGAKLKDQIRFGVSAPLSKPDKDLVAEPNSNLDPTAMVGTPASVAEKMHQFADMFDVDELIVTCYTFDPEDRSKAMAALAAEWGL